MAALDREGIEPVSDPLTALQALAGEVVAVKDYLGRRVEVLEELRYRGMGGEQIRGELTAYERALDRSIRALESIAKLNIDERLTRVSEAQLAMMADAVDWALEALIDLPASPRRNGKRVSAQQQDIGNLVLHVLQHALRNPGHRKPPFDPIVAERVERHRQRWQDALRVSDVEAELAAAHEEIAQLRGQLTLARVTREPLALEAPRPPEVLTAFGDGEWRVIAEAPPLVEVHDEPRPARKRTLNAADDITNRPGAIRRTG